MTTDRTFVKGRSWIAWASCADRITSTPISITHVYERIQHQFQFTSPSPVSAPSFSMHRLRPEDLEAPVYQKRVQLNPKVRLLLGVSRKIAIPKTPRKKKGAVLPTPPATPALHRSPTPYNPLATTSSDIFGTIITPATTSSSIHIIDTNFNPQHKNNLNVPFPQDLYRRRSFTDVQRGFALNAVTPESIQDFNKKVFLFLSRTYYCLTFLILQLKKSLEKGFKTKNSYIRLPSSLLDT